MNQASLISVRVSSDLAKRLASLANSTHRSKSYIASQAIEEYVNVHEWQVEAIKGGMAAAKRGEVVSHEQAKAMLQAWGQGHDADD